MSDAYRRRLVDTGSTGYDRIAAGTVGAAFLLFAAAVGTFFGWVPTGEAGLTSFGIALLGLGLVTAALGVASYRLDVATTPSESPGLVAGAVLALLWLATAGAVAGWAIGTVGWVLAIVVGVGIGYATLASPEDLGSTLPVGAFLVLVGALVAAGVLGPEWAWESSAFAATFPADVVVPLLALLGSLLAGWTAGKAYGGFGARGRQHGAFLLVSLVVFLVMGVLAFLLLYVAERGIGTAVENLTVSAGTLLLLVALPLFVSVRRGRRGLGSASGVTLVAVYLWLALAGTFTLVAAALGYAVVTGDAVTTETTTVQPTAAVGALPAALVSGLALLAVRQAKPWRPSDRRARTLKRAGVVLAVALAAGVLVELFVAPVAVAGVSVFGTFAVAVSALSGAAIAARLGTRLRDSPSPVSLPPLEASTKLFLWGVLGVSLHVLVTGTSVGTQTAGLVASGTIDWPFVMNPTQGLGIQRGVMPALIGTVWIVIGAVVFAVPIAVGAAVFLTEYAEDSLFTKGVDVATNGLWSTPSIVFGLFGLAFIVPRFGNSGSIFASQLVLGFMLLPLVLVTSREAMQSVPDEYRDASAALGVSKWDTIREVVIPASMPGIITGVILGVGRIAGETAPLLLVLNGPVAPTDTPAVLSSFEVGLTAQPPFVHVTNPALLESASALPYQLYAIITAGVLDDMAFGWATAFVLLGVVLSFFAVAVASRRYFRRKLHHD
ncbi:ABC-type phosphate transport system, permease component [Halapricum desulfuricans]|uniref:Phosphate transport system permease protein PstA n=1 Tax=Halapricum desulfuricans TaxID=2841257 RepID=A0A897MWS0_9EURY|nr:phosphate ABC transporter permease PstA [Halapricum desulfuricans]QSG04721.1 ABC-type phosphate transport system, permease component [Halapricum desulfuricans]